MTDETKGGVGVGDSVTFIDTEGAAHSAICTSVHDGDTIAVVYREGSSFDDFGGGDFVERTSVPAATETDQPFSYIEGGWSA